LHKAKERDIAQAVVHHGTSVNLVRETLPAEQKVYHVKVLKTSCVLLYLLLKWNFSENFWRRMRIATLTVDTSVPFVVSQEQEDVK
jgi:hypothetical protein